MLNTVFTTDIRHTLENFRRSVDQLFDNFYGFGYPAERPAPTATEGRPEWTFSPAVESWWTDDYLNLRAVIPGVSENDPKVSVQNNQQLVIEGERRAPEGFGRNAFTQLA